MSPLKLPSSFKMTHSSKKIPLVNMNNDNLNTSTEKSKTIKFKNVKSPTPKRRDEHTHLKYYIDDHINSRRRDICIKKMKRTLNEISNLNDVENIRSAFTVSEDLATRMKSIIEEFSLNKFKNCITKDILIRIYESHEFQSVRLIANELRKVGLKFQHENEKAAFLLNIFNSLVLYSVIVNKHRPDNIFSWRKEFKTCFFEIGGFYLSLIDISCLILNSETFLSEPRNFNPNSEKLKSFMQGFAISKLESISFGMSIPIR